MSNEKVEYKSIWYSKYMSRHQIGIVIRIYTHIDNSVEKRAWIGLTEGITRNDIIVDEVYISLTGDKFPVDIAEKLVT